MTTISNRFRYRLLALGVRNVALLLLLIYGKVDAAELVPKGQLVFDGSINGSTNISGLAPVSGLLAIAADEGVMVDLLRKQSDSQYRLVQSIPLLKPDDEKAEIDIEGLTSDGNILYAIGSHSLTRKQVDPDDDYDKNRKRLTKVSHDDHRDNLFRLKINSDGTLDKKKSIDLRDLLKDDPILGPFCEIPSKENGVDIEGIAFSEDRLFVGFRGPVLRQNHVPVMVLRFDSPDEYELRFVHLEGRGIRDITQVKDGFLLIAGPVGDGDADYRLYFWDGKDGIPGSGHAASSLKVLGVIPCPPKAKAEGVTLLEETDQNYRVLVVYDGPENGNPTVFEVTKSTQR